MPPMSTRGSRVSPFSARATSRSTRHLCLRPEWVSPVRRRGFTSRVLKKSVPGFFRS